MGGGGWWINPLQTLPQGLVLTFDFDFDVDPDPDPDPELDNILLSEFCPGPSQVRFGSVLIL